MRLFLTLVAVAALASAKPVEKTKRQFQFYPQATATGRRFNYDSGFVQPEITNVGTSGLANSPNNFVSTASGASFSDNLPTSTIAPEILNANPSSTQQVLTGNLAQVFGSAPEQILTRNLVASTSPIVGASGQVLAGTSFASTPSPLIGSEQVFAGNFASTSSPLIGSEQVFAGNFASTSSPLIGTEQVFASTPSPLIGSGQVFAGNFASTQSPLIGSEQVFAGNFGSTPSPVIVSGSTPSSLIGSEQVSSGIAASSRSFSSSPFVNFDSIQNRNFEDYNNYFSNVQQSQSYGKSNVEVTKNVYFYEAPEDLEPVRARKIFQVPQTKTNYKLLFIKAPSVPEPQPIEIPANLYQNEKTRVYVLVKKPQLEQEVKVVAGPTPKPEKPEVFYIKYNTKEEAEKAIKDAEAGIESGKEFLTVDSGKQLVSSIKDNAKKVSFESISFNNHQLQGGFESSTILPGSPVLGFKTFESSTAAPFVASSTFQPFIGGGSTVELYKNNPFLNAYSPGVFSPVNVKFAGLNAFSTYPTAGLGNAFFDYNNQVDLRSGKNLDDAKLVVKDEPVQVRVIGGSLDKTSTQTPIFTNFVNEIVKSTTEAVEIDSTTVSE